MKSPAEEELSFLENEAFDLEWEFRVEKAHSSEYYRKSMDELKERINTLMVEVYGAENIDPDDCQCGIHHLKESYFLKNYYNKKRVKK